MIIDGSGADLSNSGLTDHHNAWAPRLRVQPYWPSIFDSTVETCIMAQLEATFFLLWTQQAKLAEIYVRYRYRPTTQPKMWGLNL
jgi:hypothetical protein